MARECTRHRVVSALNCHHRRPDRHNCRTGKTVSWIWGDPGTDMGAQTDPYLVIVIKHRTGVIIEPGELPLEGKAHAALLAPLRG